jgi:hypothetical protein
MALHVHRPPFWVSTEFLQKVKAGKFIVTVDLPYRLRNNAFWKGRKRKRIEMRTAPKGWMKKGNEEDGLE